MPNFDIVQPSTTREAILALAESAGEAAVLSGGTGLVAIMKTGLFAPTLLVSLKNLRKELSGIRISPDGNKMCIGAMTTFTTLATDKVVRHHFPVVARAMPQIANVRVRNVATVGGNLAHGASSLDLPPIWAALDAVAVIEGLDGERRMPAIDVPIGFYENSLNDDELITGIEVSLEPRRAGHYVKFTTRAKHDWPALGLAIAFEREDGHIANARLVLSAATERAIRLPNAEAALAGCSDPETVAEIASKEAPLEDDAQASAVYKAQLLRVAVIRAILDLSKGVCA